jgi:hypothetical protein
MPVYFDAFIGLKLCASRHPTAHFSRRRHTWTPRHQASMQQKPNGHPNEYPMEGLGKYISSAKNERETDQFLSHTACALLASLYALALDRRVLPLWSHCNSSMR